MKSMFSRSSDGCTGSSRSERALDGLEVGVFEETEEDLVGRVVSERRPEECA